MCLLRGDVISEYGPGVEPAPWRFPARNRIVAAIADTVVCVEARERSGSMITVDYAVRYGRPVFAVPWHRHPDAFLDIGTNELIENAVAHELDSEDAWPTLAQVTVEQAEANGVRLG
jgi:DNA processing protein